MNDVAESITRTFPDSDAPSAGNLALDDCSFCVAIHRGLAGRRWTAVPRETLEEQADSLAQLTPAAFAYYLPAFLRQAVEYPEIPGVGASHSLDFTVQSLCDPDLPEDDWWRERVALLSEAQRRTIAVFLEWVVELLASNEDEARLQRQAQQALEKYWAQYLRRSEAG